MKGAVKQFVDCNRNFFYYGLRISKYFLVYNDFKMKIKIWLRRNSYQFYCYANTGSKGMDHWCKSLLILRVQDHSIFYNTIQVINILHDVIATSAPVRFWHNSTNMMPAMGFKATVLELTNKKKRNGWNDKQRAL